MKTFFTSLLLPTSFLTAAEVTPSAFAQLNGGFYEGSEPYYGITGGIGIEHHNFAHHLFIGVNKLSFEQLGARNPFEQPRPDEDLNSLLFGYRLSYVLTEKFTIYGELGWEYFDHGETVISDALGNPLSINQDSDHGFIGLGVQGEIYKNWSLNFTFRLLDDADLIVLKSDALGNPTTFNNSVNYSVNLSLTYSF